MLPSINFVKRQPERFKSQRYRRAQTAGHHTGGQKRVERATIIAWFDRSVFFS
jgi:hypothetical protein